MSKPSKRASAPVQIEIRVTDAVIAAGIHAKEECEEIGISSVSSVVRIFEAMLKAARPSHPTLGAMRLRACRVPQEESEY